ACPCALVAASHRHRTRDAIALEPSVERDVAGIAFPLRRDGKTERAVGELDLGDRPRAAPGSHELSDERGPTGPFNLEPGWRRLGAPLYDEIPAAQQRLGCT